MAAGSGDPGYFGPRTLVWEVVVHPVTGLIAGQVAFLMQMTHRDMQAVMLGHDTTIRASQAGLGQARQWLNRAQRTVGVPIPVVLGDRQSADRVAAHLRRIHRRMVGIVPGTDEPYAAGSPELVVFGHVTIAHAFLRTYEALAFRKGRPPARLPDVLRDRYFREFAPFAGLMGAPASAEIPESAAAVADYYATLTDHFQQLPDWRAALVKLALATLRPTSARELPSVAGTLWYDASLVLALGIIPRAVRRLWGLPPPLDPILDRVLDAARPAFLPLTIDAIGDRAASAVIGPENLELVRAARRAITTQNKQREVPIAA